MTPPAYAFGLIGYPLGHSLSPRLHAAALRSLGLAGKYRLYPAPPGGEGAAAIRELLEGLRAGEVHGLNVTIPHKQTVLPWLDELTPVAAVAGAANTLYCRDGRLVGDNTDAPAFLSTLRQLGLLNSRQVLPGEPSLGLVLGAGGAARAVCYALLSAGWRVAIAARRPDQARELADRFRDLRPSPEIHGKLGGALAADASDREKNPSPLELEPTAIARFVERKRPALIVNATPLGMAPQVDGSPWPAGIALPRDAFVYDLIYNPAETTLLRAARSARLPGANGLPMLVEQAALAFERWTGLSPARQAMLDSVGAEL